MAAAHTEKVLSGTPVSPEKQETPARKQSSFLKDWSRTIARGALSVQVEALLLSHSIIHVSSLARENEDPAVHCSHPSAHTSP